MVLLDLRQRLEVMNTKVTKELASIKDSIPFGCVAIPTSMTYLTCSAKMKQFNSRYLKDQSKLMRAVYRCCRSSSG